MPKIPFARLVLGVLFIFAGAMHFKAPRAYESVMPPYLPYPRELVLISGACEMAGGMGILLPPPVRAWAGWGLVALLVAIFPANIEIARRGVQLGQTTITPLWGWLRLPLQIPLIAWVWYAAVRPSKS